MPENKLDSPKTVSGKKLVWWSVVVVLLVAGFVMVRIVQVSGPGPDPSTIPER